MPAINFRKEYAPRIESGEKCQTIRAPRADNRPHCKVGDKLALYVGMRTKGCRKLMEVTCTGREQVVITREGRVFVAGEEVRDLEDFARKDGFDSADDFIWFFNGVHGLPFEGSLISWASPERTEKGDG